MKKNRLTPEVKIGPITMGGGHSIVIQSMTNTDTSDIKATVAQAVELAQAGAQVIRMTVNDEAAAKAVPNVIKQVRTQFESGSNLIAFVGDFHFNGNKLLKAVPECAKALDKYRINPGNADDTNFREMVEIAVQNKKVVRIGVNGGSLDPQVLDELMELNAQSPTPLSSDEIFVKAMVKSALNSARLAESYGLKKNQIVVSVKISEVNQVIAAYQSVAEQSDYCLHLGLTEAGSGLQGVVQSSIALGVLLNQNIGDTIRVSLTPNKKVLRSEEVEVCKQILQSLDLQRFRPKVISCPGCGRTTSTFFQDLAARVNTLIDQKLEVWKKEYPGVENLNIAVMGCVVNGPGESKYADIAISLPGKMEKAQAPVYIDGELSEWLKGDDIENQFIEILERYIKKRFI
jgi:(E)-4-hydroxy-3-methylbut-2-enyl-diphosphate synthase